MSDPRGDAALAELLGAEHVARLRPQISLRSFKDGDFLYHESHTAKALWAVRSGEVRTVKGNSSGRLMALESLYPGDLFGLSVMGDGASYTETAQGVTAGEVWHVPRRAIAMCLEADPELTRRLLAIVARRLQAAQERLCAFAHSGVPERLARVVLEASRKGRIEKTRRLLGESAGTTVETAIRVLRRFEHEGWIEGGVGWIRIVDRDALTRLAAGEDPAS